MTSQKEDEKVDDAPEEFVLDDAEDDMDFSLPSKKKKRKKVKIDEGDEVPAEESKSCSLGYDVLQFDNWRTKY